MNLFNYLIYLFEVLPNIDPSNQDQLALHLPWSTTLPEASCVPNKSKKKHK
ncbi:hypothetical protein KC820_12210 [Allobacillus sp. SKP8-2]|uniref:Transposase domain-containing protein n=1 Tax=Allobacillus saliphilus TaxID=2912308 RepID=A0A941HUH3_9BACI|nr:hypothetical protein [Allobacillus saliphilus]